MIEFWPNALYSREDLRTILAAEKMNADSFIAKIRPKKIFRALWLGKHLNDAMAAGPALSEKPTLPPGRNKGGRKAAGNGDLLAIDDLGLHD